MWCNIKTDPELDEITCKYCQTTFKMDDEVKHVKFDDMEQNGHEFEKGVIYEQEKDTILEMIQFIRKNMD